MGNREKTQRPLPITPLWEGKSSVRRCGSQNLCLTPARRAPWMPGSQCAPVGILLPRYGVSHSDRGDLKDLQRSLQVANPEDMAQTWHCPSARGADLALLTCGSNGRTGNSLLASPSGHCSPARSTPGEQ